jgi:outer membrane protein assembly factor BamE (lipoprotein component of BamABCDE complex)
MKHFALALSMACLGAGCAVPARNMERLQRGMSHDQVQSIMGQPEAVAHSTGKECAYYVLLKDFWSRVPWSLSDRYYVCYDEKPLAGSMHAAAPGATVAASSSTSRPTSGRQDGERPMRKR